MSAPAGTGHATGEPSAWVVHGRALLPPGRPVLDLACGRGRNTRWLLAEGVPVVAVDRDVSGITDLVDRPGLTVVELDLEDGRPFPFAPGTFGGIVVTNYLHRPLFAELVAALAPGGVLLYETFAVGNERFGRPNRPEFLLRPGELLEVVRGELEVVAYEHGEVAEPRPAVVQRIRARRQDTTIGTERGPRT